MEDGKLFDKMRREGHAFTEGATLEELTPFLYFLDKYVSKLVGRRELNNYFKTNRSMTLLDKITESDIAYAMLLCENGVDVWDESAEIKDKCNTPEAKKDYKRTATQSYHVERGTRLTLYQEGWTTEGKNYHNHMKRCLIKMKENEELWGNVTKQWRNYAEANGKNCYENKDCTTSKVMKQGEGDDSDDDDDDNGFDLPGEEGYNVTVTSVDEECDKEEE